MSYTVACEDRDHPEWHRGIDRAYLWGFLVDMDLAPARAALAGLLLPRYERQPHVTLAYCGLAEMEFDDARLAADLARLRRAADGPVGLRPVGWGSFLGSPMLEVTGDWLQGAHALLAGEDEVRRLRPYRPHITLGFYSGRWPVARVLDALAAVPPPGGWHVEQLHLLSYATRDIAGELHVEGRFDLATGGFARVTVAEPRRPARPAPPAG